MCSLLACSVLDSNVGVRPPHACDVGTPAIAGPHRGRHNSRYLLKGVLDAWQLSGVAAGRRAGVVGFSASIRLIIAYAPTVWLPARQTQPYCTQSLPMLLYTRRRARGVSLALVMGLVMGWLWITWLRLRAGEHKG